MVIRVKTEIVAMSYVWNILRRQFSQELVDGVKGIKLVKDKYGAAFDIPESLKSEMTEAATGNGQNRSFVIEFPTELPELAEDDRPRIGGDNRSGSYGRGGYNQSNGGGQGYDRNRRGGGGYGNQNSSNGNGRSGSYGRGGNDQGGERRSFGGGGGGRDKNAGQNKVFVGNLSYNTDDRAMKSAFEGSGFSVVDSFIIKGRID